MVVRVTSLHAIRCRSIWRSVLACSERACTRQYRCVWLYLQEVMLVGITAPMYAVHFHARGWRPLDSIALLLCAAGALGGPHEVQTLGTCHVSPFIGIQTRQLPAHQLAASLGSHCFAPYRSMLKLHVFSSTVVATWILHVLIYSFCL